MFSVRIVTTDHYQADPIPGLDVQYSDFRGSDVRKVPVVRVYGSTSGGQKTCMHIHGVFPYLYVPYDGTQPWDRYLRQFAASVDKAINVAQNKANSNFQHVYKITLVSGIPMYGYHPKEQQFLKIYFYNPNIIRKVADLLLGGAVLNKVFQPHESHIPYTLQLFIDYNLYGMNMLNVAAVKFRRKQKDVNANPVEDNSPASSQNSNGSFLTSRTSQSSSQDSSTGKVWTDENIPCDLYLDSSVDKQSVCELEVDVVAADILNRLEVDANVGTNPGLAALWEDEKQRRRNLGESSQITPPDSQEHDNVVIADSDRMWMERFHQIILEQEPYMDSQSDTVSESSQDDMVQVDIATQASELELHLSQQEDIENVSQDTLMMEGDSDEEPIVNVESIHRVISMSQSFSATPVGSGEAKDKSLAQILASLASEDFSDSSQEAASQVAVLEEKDSILLEKATVPDDAEEEVDDRETLEMSQQVWEGDDDSQDENKCETNEEGNKHNLEGMDETWEESQLMLRLDTDSEEEDKIPQLDGTDDRKPDKPAKRRKRLGPRGPVIQRSTHQGQGDMQYASGNIGPSGGNQMMNMPYPGQQMMNQQQGYNQYQNFSEHGWNQHQDNSINRDWGHDSSAWMGGNQNVNSGNQYSMMSSAQPMSHRAYQNVHTQQQQQHDNTPYQQDTINQTPSNINRTQPEQTSSNWSGHGGEKLQGQNQHHQGIHQMQSTASTMHQTQQLHKQSTHNLPHYGSSEDNVSIHDSLQSPQQQMQSPPHTHALSPQGHIQSPRETLNVHSNLTQLHNTRRPHENLTSPHSNLTSPVNVLSPSQNNYPSKPQRSLATSSEPSCHSYQQFSNRTDNTYTVGNFSLRYLPNSAYQKHSKAAKNLDAQFQQKNSSFIPSNNPQSPQPSPNQYQLSSSGFTSSGEICPGQKNVQRSSQQRTLQSEIPNTLERLLSRDDSQDSTGSNTPQRCSSHGSVNSNTSSQSRVTEHLTTPNPNATQSTPNKFNLSSSSQSDLFLEETAVSKSPFSPLDSARKDSNLSDGSFLSEGISPFCSGSSDIVNESPKVTYLTASDVSDYQPSSSLTTLTRLESLVSNVSLEQSYGRNLEKCVKGKNAQNRKQALSTVQRSSPYGTWSDSDNSHCSPAEMSGQFQHSASPMRSSGMTPQGRYHYRSHSADMVPQPGYFFESNEFRSFENEHAMQQFDNISQNAERIPHHMMDSDMLHGYHFSENLTDLDAINKTQRVPKSWNARYQDTINTQMAPNMTDYSHPYDPFSKPDLMRSMSMPVVEKKKRGRPKGFKLNKNRSNSTSSLGNGKGAAYTFTFHVPTPVFKHLKLKKVFQKVNSTDNIKLVRMHPKDARKYSLLKIGREVVKIPKLSEEVLIKHLGSLTNSVSSSDEQEDECTTSEETECDEENESKRNTDKSRTDQTKQSHTSGDISKDNMSDDSCDEGSGKFLGVSLDEFIPQATWGEETENCESVEKTCESPNDRGKSTSEVDRKENITTDCSNVVEKISEVKFSKGDRGSNSLKKSNGEHSQNGQNRESEETLQDSDYMSIAAVTLNSIIDRVIENTVNDFSNERSNHSTYSTQNGGNGTVQPLASNQHVNSVRNVLPQQNIVQYVTSDLPVFNYHRNNFKNVFHQDSHQKHLLGSVGRSFMDTFDVLNSPREKTKLSKVVDITSPFHSTIDHYKYQRRKPNGYYKYNSNPFIVDPDYDDIEHIVLKDVSLTEATDGTLTPLKTRTPTAGRSPRSGFGQDQYRLFESDFVSKLGNLAADLEMPELLNEKDQSSSESNYSSYSDFSRLKNGESHNNRKRKGGILGRLASDFNENYLGTVDLNTKRKKKSKLKLSSKKDKSSKGKKKEEVEGIDYIIIGKFKGIKKMVVKLNRLFIKENSVNLNEFHLTSEKLNGSHMTKLKTPCDNESDKSRENMKNNLTSSENNGYVSVNSHDKENNIKGKLENIPNRTIEPQSNTKENEIHSDVMLSESFWWLNSGRKSLTDDDVSKEMLRKNKLSLSKRKFNSSNNKYSLEVLNGKPKKLINNKQGFYGFKEQLNGLKLLQREINLDMREKNGINSDSETDGRDSPVIPVLTKESLGGPDSPVVPVINKEFSDPDSPAVPVLIKEPQEEQCQDDSEKNNIEEKSVTDHETEGCTENMELGNETSWNPDKKQLSQDKDAFSNSLMEQTPTKLDLISNGNVGKIPENENSNSSKSSDIKDSMDENDSDSRSSLDIVSPYSNSKEQGKNRKKKKNLTRNQRLQVAFVGTKPKRRKTNGTETKLMCSLSLLHQATLANLNEPSSCYTDDVDDYRVGYQDAMLKMSMLSPPDSEKGSISPPQPDSPEDLEKELNWTSKFRTSGSKNGGKELSKFNPLESKKNHSQLYIKIEELRQKQSEDLEKSRNLTSNSVKTSGDSLYETPLSSIEAPMEYTSKSSECLSPVDADCICLNSIGDSEGTMQDGLLKDENFYLQQSGQSSSLQSENCLISEARKNFKKAFVKIDKLSDAEVDKYCSDVRPFPIKQNKRKRSVSPPDLGPPNIPDISLENEENSKSPPPLLLSLNSPRLDLPCSLNLSKSPDPSCSLSPSKSPASSSSSSFNVIHCDTFSDISDDEMCNDTVNEGPQKDDVTNFISLSSGNSPRQISSELNDVVLNTVVKLTGESNFGLSSSEKSKSLNSSAQSVRNHIVSTVSDGKHNQNSGNTGNRSKFSESSKVKNYHSRTSSESVDSSEDQKSEFNGPSTSKQKMGPNENEKEKTEPKMKKFTYEPRIKPPSRKQVDNTAINYGLHLTRNQEAFCSNIEDLPEKPRELGGRILKVQSYRVKDLNEFKMSSKCDGLNSWRNLFIANDQTFFSQSDNVSLLTKIAEEPSLRFAIFPDRDIVISPCKPPPSKKSVESWCKRRKLHQSHKNKTKLPSKNHGELTNKNKDNLSHDKNTDDDNRNDKIKLSCDDSFKIIQNDDSNSPGFKIRLKRCKNPGDMGSDNFSSKKEKDSKDIDSRELVAPILSPHAMDVSGIPLLETSNVSLSPEDMEKDILSPSPPKDELKVKFKSAVFKPWTPFRLGENENRTLHSTPVNKASVKNITSNDDIDNSTPVRKPVSKDLFDVGFTPINRDKSVSFKVQDDRVKTGPQESSVSGPQESSEPGTGFVTPKDVPLSKKLSNTTETSLRQSLTSQLQDISTPGHQKAGVSQIDAPTPKNQYGFKVSQLNLQDAKALHEVQNLTVLSLELHTESRQELKPDPEFDAIVAVFYCIHNDVLPEKGKRDITGVIIVDKESAKIQDLMKKRESQKQSHDDVDQDDSLSEKSRSKGQSPQPSTSSTSTSNVISSSPQPSTSRDYSSPSNSQKAGDSNQSKDNGSEQIGKTLFEKSGIDQDLEITYVTDEQELFRMVIELITEWDPDILVGYEIQMLSWGYLLQRAAHLSIDLCKKMSRIPDSKTGSHFSAEKDEWGADHSSEIHIVGRIVLNLWRLLRHEVSINVYTFENIAFHVLHQRIPYFSFKVLNSWFNHRTHLHRWRFLRHYLLRVKGNMQIIDHLDLIGRTSEFARVFGIEFYHVLSRGSQYRVESMMLRLAKPLNFIPVSPSVHQRARMKAPECIPLTLEPESNFFPDPVVVLDFQSLYPSIMIAYNYCFSTCLGRIDWLSKAHEGPIDFGCTSLNVSPSTLQKLKDDITVSPNGMAFVKQHVRKGVISAMVEEILGTRIMVKRCMKDYKNDKGLHRLLDARQLGLKLIANVTYGYTAANYSGRMPCIEVADSIVRKARETLERAIKLVEDTPEWGAKVVYGDTDSLFILLKGRSKDEAFKIGYEICDAVTNMNPKPIKLKFEKVYLPCALESKKRYVGFMYETPDQKEPVYDAKGIETVRRDSCSAVSKILEKTIKILFTSRDVSQVKQYVQTQCRKLMEGKVSMQDCIFAKEYRGMSGYKPGSCVPALEISKKLLRQDRRAEPRVGERVPYVIVYGTPGLPLIKLVRQPMELVLDPTLRINATYYITKQILPPLSRLLSLLGVDVFSWYNDMPRFVRIVPQTVTTQETKRGTISQYFSAVNCPVCDQQTNQNICNKCMSDPQIVAVTLNSKIRHWEKVYQDLMQVCNSCMGTQDDKQPCISLDCPIFFRRVVANLDINKGSQLREVANKALDF